jgi:uncharacterized protein
LSSRPKTVGLISDTHGFWDPALPGIFAGVDLILHAGDVGRSEIIRRLERIAPVKAVIGNVDAFLSFAEREIVSFEGVKIVLQHIVNPGSPDTGLLQSIHSVQPQAVVFGHTHRPYAQWHDSVFYFNPGAAGPARFNLPRTVGFWHIQESKIRSEHITLAGSPSSE